MALASGRRFGPYEVTEQIGVGGMGEVYRATDTKSQRDVAIKVLPESFATLPDGERMVVTLPAAQAGVNVAAGSEVVIVENWLEEARQRVPVQ